MGILRPGRDVVPGPGIYPGMEWPAVSGRSSTKRRRGFLAQQHEHEERLRRLALRTPQKAGVEFPGRYGAYLKTRGGGSYRFAVEYTIDPRPVSAGGNDEYEVTILLDYIPVAGLIDERARIGIYCTYDWPTRAQITGGLSGSIWDGRAQAAVQPDGGTYDPVDTSGQFLGNGEWTEDLTWFGAYGAARYANFADPHYPAPLGFPRTGVFLDPVLETKFGDPRAGSAVTFRMTDEAGFVMTDAWRDACHAATGNWPPSMTIHTIEVRFDQDSFDAADSPNGLSGSASAFHVVFDTVDFVDDDITAVRLAGTELPGTDPGLANAILLPEGGTYRFVAGAECPYNLHADGLTGGHDMESASVEVFASWPSGGGFDDFDAAAWVPGVLETNGAGQIISHHAAGQISGLMHIPLGGARVNLTVQPTGGVDQGGSAADWEGTGSSPGASPDSGAAAVTIPRAHLAVWRYYLDAGDEV